MAQAAHGSAPDIAGRDVANPISLILSAALLLAWHGERARDARYTTAARAIEGRGRRRDAERPRHPRCRRRARNGGKAGAGDGGHSE